MSAFSSTHPAMQRKTGPVATLPSSGRVVKRRASRACQCCQSRKVKCDVVERGIPCTKCRLDKVECAVSNSKKRKWRHSGELSTHSPDPPHDTSEECPPQEEINAQGNGGTLDDFLSTMPFGLLDLELNHHALHEIDQTKGHRVSQGQRARRNSSDTQSSPPNLPSPAETTNCHPSERQEYSPSVSLPRYIRALPSSIEADNIEFLEKKGALTIPETGLRNELLRNYMQYVHPYLPLLDLKDFLQPIQRNDGTMQISLLLFQAVMFAATAYIDMRFLRAHGYDDRKTVRKIFFQRAQLLYYVDCELNRLSIVQALLLMTYWYEKPNDQKDICYWMGISLSVAYTIGLQHNPEHSNMDVKMQRQWKRTWWSCFMRDRIVALAMRRPTLIKNETYDVPMLVVDDFDTEPLPVELLRIFTIDCLTLRDAKTRSALTRMYIEKVKLCFYIDEVLTTQYSVVSHNLGCTTETTVMLAPKKFTATVESLEDLKCDHELDQWHHNLAEEIRYQKPQTKGRVSENEGVLIIHRALLRMIYLTTLSALYRPQVLSASPTTAVAAFLQERSRTRVKDAAIEITEIVQDLNDQGLVRFLPSTVIQVLIPAIIVHLSDIKSGDSVVRNAGSRRYRQSVHVLQQLRERFAAADFAFSVLEVAIRKANVDVPQETTLSQATYQIEPHCSNGPAVSRDASTTLFEPETSSSKGLHYPRTIITEPDIPLGSISSEGPIESSNLSTSRIPVAEEFDMTGLESNVEVSANFANFFDELINFDSGESFLRGRQL